MDGGADGSVFIENAPRWVVYDTRRGIQKRIFRDGIIRDRYGKAVTRIEGISESGFTDWQALRIRLTSTQRVLQVCLKHPTSGTIVCSLDALSGTAVVSEDGAWKAVSRSEFMDERAGWLADVGNDGAGSSVSISNPEENIRFSISLPPGASGRFTEVVVDPKGEKVAVLLSDAAVYVIDTARKKSVKVAAGPFINLRWSPSGTQLLAVRPNLNSGTSDLVTIDINSKVQMVINAHVDSFELCSVRRSMWKPNRPL